MNLFGSGHLCSVANMQAGVDSPRIELDAGARQRCLRNLITPRSSVEILSSESIKNHLLAALPHAESQRWLPELESIDMPLGQVLYESGDR